MKKVIAALAIASAIVFAGCASPASGQGNATPAQPAVSATASEGSGILFINTSRDPEGNTKKMGDALLEGIPHDTLFLNDYKIYQLGQHYDDDQFDQVLAKMKSAKVIVIGTPVYWHTMSGPLKTLIDRMYEIPKDSLAGKKLYFIMQGAAPSEETKKMVPYTMSRVAAVYSMDYEGYATGMDGVPALHQKLLAEK